MFLIYIVISVMMSPKPVLQQKHSWSNCELLGSIFKEELFYSHHYFNLKLVDTIVVLDKSNYFCNCQKLFTINVDEELMEPYVLYDSDTIFNIFSKVVIVKTQETLPANLINISYFSDKILSQKYRNFFILNEPVLFEDTLKINLFKMISKHNIDLEYKLTLNSFSLVRYTIGQY